MARCRVPPGPGSASMTYQLPRGAAIHPWWWEGSRGARPEVRGPTPVTHQNRPSKRPRIALRRDPINAPATPANGPFPARLTRATDSAASFAAAPRMPPPDAGGLWDLAAAVALRFGRTNAEKSAVPDRSDGRARACAGCRRCDRQRLDSPHLIGPRNPRSSCHFHNSMWREDNQNGYFPDVVGSSSTATAGRQEQ